MHPSMVEVKPKAKSGESLGDSQMAALKDKADGKGHGKALLRQQTAVAQLGQLALASSNLSALLQQATVLVCQTLDVEFARVWEDSEDGKTMWLRGGYRL